jgi:hypothetical protein
MRKLISLGVLAILLSMLASSAVAGSEKYCEVLKEDGITKGLYGLCIAYWGADNGRSQERILGNYRKKMRPVYPGDRKGTGDPDMPGLVDDLSCPCWTIGQMANAITFAPAYECNTSSDPEFAVYGTKEGAVVTFLANSNGCFYVGPDIAVISRSLELEDEQACRDGIQALVDEDFTAIPCT